MVRTSIFWHLPLLIISYARYAGRNLAIVSDNLRFFYTISF